MTALRQRIEKESLKLFVKKGIHATTIRDISHAAKVSEGALYRHYKSKDELAEALFVNHYTGFYQALEELIDIKQDFSHNITAITTFFSQEFEKQPAVLQYCLLTQHNYIDSVKALNTPFSLLTDFFEHFYKKKQCSIKDPMVCCTIIFGVLLQAMSFRISKRIKSKMTDDAPLLAQAITKALS